MRYTDRSPATELGEFLKGVRQVPRRAKPGEENIPLPGGTVFSTAKKERKKFTLAEGVRLYTRLQLSSHWYTPIEDSDTELVTLTKTKAKSAHQKLAIPADHCLIDLSVPKGRSVFMEVLVPFAKESGAYMEKCSGCNKELPVLLVGCIDKKQRNSWFTVVVCLDCARARRLKSWTERFQRPPHDVY